MPELGLFVIADGLLQRDGNLGAAADLLHLVGRELELAGDLARGRLAAELGAELALGAHDLVQLLDHVDGHPDRPGLVRERPGDRLADPPGRVGRELEALAVVELLGRANQADRALLNQVQEGQPLVSVPLRDRDDETEVRLDHLALCVVVAALDPLRELDLLRRRQELDLADVLEEELQRVGRDLALALALFFVLGFVSADDLDVQLLEGAEDHVQLGRIQIEVPERERDLVRADRPRLLRRNQQALGLLGLQDVYDAPRGHSALPAHLRPLPVRPFHLDPLRPMSTLRSCGSFSRAVNESP